jgi:hypothetical protein
MSENGCSMPNAQYSLSASGTVTRNVGRRRLTTTAGPWKSTVFGNALPSWNTEFCWPTRK